MLSSEMGGVILVPNRYYNYSLQPVKYLPTAEEFSIRKDKTIKNSYLSLKSLLVNDLQHERILPSDSDVR